MPEHHLRVSEVGVQNQQAMDFSELEVLIHFVGL